MLNVSRLIDGQIHGKTVFGFPSTRTFRGSCKGFYHPSLGTACLQADVDKLW